MLHNYINIKRLLNNLDILINFIIYYYGILWVFDSIPYEKTLSHKIISNKIIVNSLTQLNKLTKILIDSIKTSKYLKKCYIAVSICTILLGFISCFLFKTVINIINFSICAFKNIYIVIIKFNFVENIKKNIETISKIIIIYLLLLTLKVRSILIHYVLIILSKKYPIIDLTNSYKKINYYKKYFEKSKYFLKYFILFFVKENCYYIYNCIIKHIHSSLTYVFFLHMKELNILERFKSFNNLLLKFLKLSIHISLTIFNFAYLSFRLLQVLFCGIFVDFILVSKNYIYQIFLIYQFISKINV